MPFSGRQASRPEYVIAWVYRGMWGVYATDGPKLILDEYVAKERAVALAHKANQHALTAEDKEVARWAIAENRSKVCPNE